MYVAFNVSIFNYVNMDKNCCGVFPALTEEGKRESNLFLARCLSVFDGFCL